MNRRAFLTRASQAGLALGLGDFAFLNNLPALNAQQVNGRNIVPLQADIEPLVRLIEETERNTLLEIVAQRIRGGTSYQELLGALMLAGVRGIQPRPVGFKFHAVLVVNSAHLATVAATDRDRWLPLFWALDFFKNAQNLNAQQGDWRMAPVAESRVPPSHQARERFQTAMDSWDVEGTDLAIASLVRNAGAAEVIEMFWRYGARDFRAIGHKAIYVANAWRTLQVMGWRHAEPIMRSLAYALLAHEGTNPAQRDDNADRPGRENQRRLTRIRDHWQRGNISATATRDLLAALRSGTPAQASEQVVTMLNQQIDPASVWDGLLLMAGELLMRQPGIVGLHTVTTTNALYYGYQTSANDTTRRFLTLQAAAFLPLFRGAMMTRNPRPRDDVAIDTLEPTEPQTRGAEAIEEVFADVSRDRMVAARKTLAILARDPSRAEALIAAGRRLIFSKGSDSHDYKFSSAALEDFYHVTPAWRNQFLATSMFNLKGSAGADTGVYRRTRAALGAS